MSPFFTVRPFMRCFWSGVRPIKSLADVPRLHNYAPTLQLNIFCVSRSTIGTLTLIPYYRYRSSSCKYITTDQRYHDIHMASPGNKLRWNLTKSDFSQCTDKLIAKSKQTHDDVGSLDSTDINYDNVVKKLADLDVEYANEQSILNFYQNVSPDKELRDASVEADKRLSEHDVEMSMRKDVFDKLVTVKELELPMSAEATRFVDRLIQLGKRNGLNLAAGVQDEVKAIKKEMSTLCIDFNSHLNEENTKLEFSSAQLIGLPQDFLDALQRTPAGNYIVSLKYPHYFPCMKFAREPETRRQLEMAFNSRCKTENTPILEKLIKLRHAKALLLGYTTHADFVLEMRMARTAETVSRFLSELAVKLRPLGERDMQLFLTLKRDESDKYGMEYDGKIWMWDYQYYMTRTEEQLYHVDQNVLKTYFPLDTVTRGMLDIYQELLSLRFTEVPEPGVWHPDVTLYSVTDVASEQLIGYFYLDLFPREGKYGHACCEGLQPGCVTPDGSRQVSVAAMLANFTKPSGDTPALLLHDEVVTYFHEFGHVMHYLCAQADFALFSGYHVECDFVEAPSQMLENWCWEAESLVRMSGHHETGDAIPDDLMEALIKSKLANSGIFNRRQILLASFDQQIHKVDSADTATVFAQLSREIMGVEQSPGTNMPASFGHMAGGYDAQYYGYMWSEVFSADMFHSCFKAEGIMSPAVGSKYRNTILKPGGSQDASDMLRNFLGREPNDTAFLASKGLHADDQS